MLCIFQNLTPNRFRLSSDDRIRKAQRFIQGHSSVNTDHDNRYTHSAENGCDLVGAGCLWGESRDAHQVWARQPLVIDGPKILIDHLNLPLRRCEARKDQKT